MRKIKVLIADDHIVLRQGTRNLLDQEPDLEVVAEAGDGEETVNLTYELMPDVILMDVAMPKMDGIEATKKIKAVCPEVSVLILSAFDDDQFVFKLLQAGAAGYLLKTVHSSELVAVVRAVHHGESVLHPSIAQKVLNRFITKSGKPSAQNMTWELNDREIEFLKLMTRGLTNKEIADALDVSLRTVQGQLRQIFKKLGVGSRTEAVVYALKKDLITLDDVPWGQPAGTSKE